MYIYRGVYGNLEKDLIEVGRFKYHKLNVIYKIEDIKSNKRKLEKFEKGLKVYVYSSIWSFRRQSIRTLQMLYMLLFDTIKINECNPIELIFMFKLLDGLIYSHKEDVYRKIQGM